MARHVSHFTVLTLGQPIAQLRFVFGQVDAGDAHLLKSELTTPEFYLRSEWGQGIHAGKYRIAT